MRLAADDGGALEPPPISGPARRRSLSRSRVLVSRKNRLDKNRLLELGAPVGLSPSASPGASALPQQQQEQAPAAPVSVFPATLGARRVAVDSALARPVKTVGDFLLSEKRMEQNRHHTPQQKPKQQQQQQQQQPPPKKQRKPKKLTKQQESVAKASAVPVASESDNDGAARATPEPTEALPKKPTKSRGQSKSGGEKPQTTIKGSPGVPVPAAAVVKASTATAGGRVDSKREKKEEMASSRGETAELGEVAEGAAAVGEARVQATAEARARLADGYANGLDGSPDASV